MTIFANNIGNGMLTLLFVCFYIISQLSLRVGGGVDNNYKNNGIWDLPPVVLSVLAGEFKGVVADYLILEMGAQVGTDLERTSDGANRIVTEDINCPTIHKKIQASQYLDPSFRQTFILAQGWLPWECGMLPETMAILQTAEDNRPWGWQESRFMAFNSYYFLNDNAEAGKIFLEAAANRRNAPSYFAILGARLAQKGGDTKGAIALMKGMLIGKLDTDPDYQDILNRFHALEGTMILEKAVKAYLQRYGTLPFSPDALVDAGLVSELPFNPYDVLYCIDAGGKVYFDKPNCQEVVN